jgi:hypothetical protein
LGLAVGANPQHSSASQGLGNGASIVPCTNFRLPGFGQDEILGATIGSRPPESGPIYCRPQWIVIGILLSVTPAGKAAFPMQLGSE